MVERKVLVKKKWKLSQKIRELGYVGVSLDCVEYEA